MMCFWHVSLCLRGLVNLFPYVWILELISILIRSLAAYAMKYARNSSCLGRNLLWCCQQYSCSLDDIFHGYGNDFTYRFCNAQILESHLPASEFLYELILIRDGLFHLPSNLTGLMTLLRTCVHVSLIVASFLHLVKWFILFCTCTFVRLLIINSNNNNIKIGTVRAGQLYLISSLPYLLYRILNTHCLFVSLSACQSAYLIKSYLFNLYFLHLTAHV
jgi:hypothetical protein